MDEGKKEQEATKAEAETEAEIRTEKEKTSEATAEAVSAKTAKVSAEDIEEKKEIKLEKPEEKKPKPQKHKITFSKWYDKNYKKLLIISLVVLVLSFVYIGFFYIQHKDIMFKDVTLTGGTAITVYTDKAIDVSELAIFLESELSQGVNVRLLEDIGTRKQIAVVVETKAESEAIEAALEQFLGYGLDNENSSLEITGASLSQSFYKQLILALVIAFIFMSIVIFIIFKTKVPCLAIILAAITDMVGALAIANLAGFRISTAGIAAFLMLIGYSIDTNVMLTTKVIKRRGEAVLNKRIKNAAKTGLMMTVTSLAAVLAAFFIVQSVVLKQIFFILSAGLFIDLISTWFGNASILKWWCEKKHI